MTPERRTELQSVYVDSVVSEMSADKRSAFISDVMHDILENVVDSQFIAGIIKSGHSSLLTSGEKS